MPPLLAGVSLAALIADKAFDSNAIVADLDARGAKVVISQHPRRISPRAIDTEMYKWRHLIENFLCKLLEAKRIALRADKTDQSFAAMVYLTAAIINSRCIPTDPRRRRAALTATRFAQGLPYRRR